MAHEELRGLSAVPARPVICQQRKQPPAALGYTYVNPVEVSQGTVRLHYFVVAAEDWPGLRRLYQTVPPAAPGVEVDDLLPAVQGVRAEDGLRWLGAHDEGLVGVGREEAQHGVLGPRLAAVGAAPVAGGAEELALLRCATLGPPP